ncbi:hypothetical protein DM860_002321 [Cuscuta australis]|uniref:Uncharacterized protein n=1 Tax=Cuscuta australis TaxID=267555 RepID=A0A328D377_9ASTE|nr:hypothetical protein DM860_002321 [Cuscuta australis]
MAMEKSSRYPKVRVKVEEEEDGNGYGLGFLSKSYDALSKDDYPTSIARIPTAHISGSSKPVTSTSTGNSKSQKTSSEMEAKTRAGLVSRPRAVLSSPDNDKMAGTAFDKPKVDTTKLGRDSPSEGAQTQFKEIRKTINAKNSLKARDVGGPGRGSPSKGAQSQCKEIPKPINAQNSLKARDVGGPAIQVKRKMASTVKQSK